MQQHYDITVKWRAFPLHPDTPEEGRTLEDLFKKKGMPVNVDQVMDQLKQTAQSLGFELGDRRMTYNSRLAQEVGLWAESNGRGHEFHMQAFKSYFTDGENIAKKAVLLNLVEQSGLDRAEGANIIDNRTFSDAVDKDWELSRQKGVTAVPTFFMGPDRLVGAQPYEAMEKMAAKYTSKKDRPRQ